METAKRVGRRVPNAVADDNNALRRWRGGMCRGDPIRMQARRSPNANSVARNRKPQWPPAGSYSCFLAPNAPISSLYPKTPPASTWFGP